MSVIEYIVIQNYYIVNNHIVIRLIIIIFSYLIKTLFLRKRRKMRKMRKFLLTLALLERYRSVAKLTNFWLVLLTFCLHLTAFYISLILDLFRKIIVIIFGDDFAYRKRTWWIIIEVYWGIYYAISRHLIKFLWFYETFVLYLLYVVSKENWLTPFFSLILRVGC